MEDLYSFRSLLYSHGSSRVLHVPETAGKTLEEVESMFISGDRAWKTKVEYGRIRAVEYGQIDPEKLANVTRLEEVAYRG